MIRTHQQLISNRPEACFGAPGHRSGAGAERRGDSYGRSALAALAAGLAGLLLLLAGCGAGVEMTEREYLARATVFERQGDYSSAIIDYKNAIRVNPGNPEARWLLGSLYLKLKFGTAAEKELINARNTGLETQALSHAIAAALLLQGRFEDVLLEAGGIDEVDPTTLAVEQLVVRGQALVHLLRTEEAENAFREALERQPGHPGATLGLARVALESTAFTNGEALIREVLDEFPDHVDGLQLLGDLHRLRGERRSALDAYSRVLESDPAHIPAHLSRAVLFSQMGLFEQAGLDADAVRKYVPDYPLASYIKAVAEYGLKNYDSAERYLHDVIDIVPFHLPSIFLLSAIQFRNNRLQQAERNLRTVIDAKPEHTRAKRLMATVLLKAKKTDRALVYLEAMVEESPDDTQLLSLIGTAYIQNKDYAKATAAIEKAAELLPNDAAIKHRLGLIHIAAGRGEEGALVLNSTVRTETDQRAVNIILALSDAEAGNLEQAMAAANRLVASDVDSPLGYYIRGKVQLKRGARAQARADLERSQEVSGGYLPGLVLLAQLDIGDGDIEAAKARYDFVLKKNPANVVALIEMSRLLQRQGHMYAAADYLDRARHSMPGELLPQLLLAKAYLRLREYAKALAVCQDVADKDRNNPQVVEIVGLSYLGTGYVDDAVETFTNLVALLPAAAISHFRLAQALIEQKQIERAVESLDAALSADPKFVLGWDLLVKLYRDQGDLDGALERAQRRVVVFPDSSRAATLVGDIQMQRGDYQQAINSYVRGLGERTDRDLTLKLFEAYRLNREQEAGYTLLQEWLEQHPDDFPVRMVRSGAYLQDGLSDQALAGYIEVIEGNPTMVEALNNASWVLFARDDARAVEFAERAHKLAPDDAIVADTLGWILTHQGDAVSERALSLLKSAVTSLPHRPDIRYHWAVALHRAGRDAEAATELKTLLRTAPGFENQQEAEQLLAEVESKS